MYVNETPVIDTDRTEHFQRTIARTFSHRPMEPEVNSPDGRFYNQQTEKRKSQA